MSRDVSLLHPRLIEKIESIKADCAAAGLPLLITVTTRTIEEQNELYEQGRTKPGKIVTNAKGDQSLHCWGVAFDFCRNVPGREYDDSDGFFEKVGSIGKKHGLSWGGDWEKFPDKPHLEMPEFYSYQTLRQLYGTPEKFRESWESARVIVHRSEFEVYPQIKDAPEWSRMMARELASKGILAGDGNQNVEKRKINLSELALQALAFAYRMDAELWKEIDALKKENEALKGEIEKLKERMNADV